MKEKISVIGLGYVGLPVALAFARRFSHTVGFDIDCTRIDELKKGHDRNNETAASLLLDSGLELFCDSNDPATTTTFVVAVPTPVDANNLAGRRINNNVAHGGVVVDAKSMLSPSPVERAITRRRRRSRSGRPDRGALGL